MTQPPSAALWIGAAAILILIVGPSLLGIVGWVRLASLRQSARADTSVATLCRQAISSALLYALAFNLTFFIQELFLVLPKAFVPGLRPTLFHNNHTWQGENPLASLLQGTGALAIFSSGLACATLIQSGAGRSFAGRLFLIWMAFNGFLQSLAQVVIGALNPRNDVGMAMNYLQLGVVTKTAAALLALAAIPAVALWLTGPLLSLARSSAEIADGRARSRFVFNVATLPAMAAVVLIIPFRVPRDPVEVVALPLVETVIGIAWLQAAAWSVRTATPGGVRDSRAIPHLLVAVLALLLVFQLLLRPGVRFY